MRKPGYKYTIDLIKFYERQGPIHTISKFDFTVCACAITREKKFFFNERLFEHIDNRRLKIQYTNGSNAFSTLKRLQKYAVRGYDMANRDLLELVRELQKINVNKISEEIKTIEDMNVGILKSFYKMDSRSKRKRW